MRILLRLLLFVASLGLPAIPQAAACVHEQVQTDNFVPGGNTWFERITATGSATVSGLRVNFGNASGETAYVGIYSDAADAPGTLLAGSLETAVTDGWNDINFTATTGLASGTVYWLALGVSNASAQHRSTYKADAVVMMSGTYGALDANPSGLNSTATTDTFAVQLGLDCTAPTATPVGTATITPTPAGTATITPTPNETLTAVALSFTVTPTPTPAGEACLFSNTMTTSFEAGGVTYYQLLGVFETGSASALQVYLTDGAGYNGYVSLHSDNVGVPGTLLASSVQTALVNGWNTIVFQSPVILSDANLYWYGFSSSDAAVGHGATFSGSAVTLQGAYGAPVSDPAGLSAGPTVDFALVLGPCGPPDTGTPTETETPAPAATQTATPSASPTASPTVSPTRTATRTATGLPTGTHTPSPSASGTATPSATSSPSATETATEAATPSATFTLMGTETPSPSASPSATATGSPTPSSTVTETATPSPTGTATDTVTPAPTIGLPHCLLPGGTNSTNGEVYAITVTASTIYVGGSFSMYLAQPRTNIAALDAVTGELLPFNPVMNGTVRALAVSGTALYMGGDFTSVNGETRNRLAAVNASTGATLAFDPNVSGSVHALAIADGMVYAGGAFTTVNNGGVNRPYLASFSMGSGSASSFDPVMNGAVHALAVSGTKLYVGGGFDLVNLSTARNRMAAFNLPSDLADNSFVPSFDGPVKALALNGTTLYAGGAFTQATGGASRNNLAAVDAVSGSIVPGFDPNMNSEVLALASLGSTLYAGGHFNDVNIGIARNGLAAFNASTGAVLPGFDPNLNGSTFAFSHFGSKLLAGGSFDIVNASIVRSKFAAFDRACIGEPDPPTATVTPTVTASFTITPTATATSSATSTFTVTPTATATFTATQTMTASPTATASFTGTATSTHSPTRSASPTHSSSPSATPSATLTLTFTSTPSVSPTGTVTQSSTTSPTPTISASPTATPTLGPPSIVSIGNQYAYTDCTSGIERGFTFVRIHVANLGRCHGSGATVSATFGATGTERTAMIENETCEEGVDWLWLRLTNVENGAAYKFVVTVNGVATPPFDGSLMTRSGCAVSINVKSTTVLGYTLSESTKLSLSMSEEERTKLAIAQSLIRDIDLVSITTDINRASIDGGPLSAARVVSSGKVVPSAIRVRVRVYNQAGRLASIVEKQVNANDTKVSIDVRDFATGIYYYRLDIHTDEGTIVGKPVKFVVAR